MEYELTSAMMTIISQHSFDSFKRLTCKKMAILIGFSEKLFMLVKTVVSTYAANDEHSVFRGRELWRFTKNSP